MSKTVITSEETVLVTGAAGFIGARVVRALLQRGHARIRCLVRPSANLQRLRAVISEYSAADSVELVTGNLLSPPDCARITTDAKVVLHLAAGRGEKLFADAFMNSVITTRNLLDALVSHNVVRRFVTISSFSVYSNIGKKTGRLLDESCPVESHPERRGDAYSFAKVKQDELVSTYGEHHKIPYVIMRPGYVFGPGNEGISNRVGIGTFGLFLHLGGGNRVPLTYVDNCADAIVLAGLTPGVDGEVFNVVDDKLPTSRYFLRMYKKNVRSFSSLYVPHALSYLLCRLWEKYSKWSNGQLPPAFNRLTWHAYWKRTRYTNDKLKFRLGWTPVVNMKAALILYFESCKRKAPRA